MLVCLYIENGLNGDIRNKLTKMKQITFKKVLGVILLSQIIPIIFVALPLILASNNIDDYKLGYYVGWMLQIIILIVVGFVKLIAWCFN